jgi:hypothetical protein
MVHAPGKLLSHYSNRIYLNNIIKGTIAQQLHWKPSPVKVQWTPPDQEQRKETQIWQSQEQHVVAGLERVDY